MIQSINQIIRPFGVDSIARDVLDVLNDGSGALSDVFARFYFETDVIKTTSVVSYGLRPLVRPSDKGPIFRRWNDPDKDVMVSSEDDKIRARYIAHCANQVGVFVAAAKSRLPSARWTTNRNVRDRLITPTIVNGLIGAMRQAVDAGIQIEFDSLRATFDGLTDFPLDKYRSSQYTVMATDIYTQFFSNVS